MPSRCPSRTYASPALYRSVVAALVSVHAVGELMMNANRASIGRSIAGDTVIALKLLLDDTPEAIVLPSGSPASVSRWISIVTGPPNPHEMFRRPMPVSVPAAPTVTVCAILPPAETAERDWRLRLRAALLLLGRHAPRQVPIDGLLRRPPQHDVAGVQSVTCTLKLNVPCLVGCAGEASVRPQRHAGRQRAGGQRHGLRAVAADDRQRRLRLEHHAFAKRRDHVERSTHPDA